MFNKKIYMEGLRQTAISGIFFIVLATIANCLSPIDTLMYESQTLANAHKNPDFTIESLDYLYNNLTSKQVNFPMSVLCVLAPILMAITQFDFLSSRKACDFYHAIPVKRSNLAINFSLASMTWVILSVIIPMVVNGIMYSFSDFTILDYSFLLPNILEKITISFLVYAAVFFGTSLVGQRLSAILVASLILFLPRFAATVVIFLVEHVTEAFRTGTFTFSNVLGNYNNLLIASITDIPTIVTSVVFSNNFMESRPVEASNYQLFPYIYTLVLASIIFALACVVFVKRKSEMAGANTANALTQHIIRCLMTFPICIFAITLYVIESNRWYNNSFYDVISTVFPVLIIIPISYFTFELATTKDAKKLVKAIPPFGVVILFTVGYYGIVDFGINTTYSNSFIDKNDVKSIQILPSYSYSLYDPYTETLIANHTITDPQAIEATVNSLATFTQENFYDDNQTNDYNYYNNLGTINMPISLKINTNSGSITRHYSVAQQEHEAIYAALYSDEYINNTLVPILPAQDDVYSIRVTSLGNNYNLDETNQLIDTVYKEYNSLTQEQKLNSIYVNHLGYHSDYNENTYKIGCDFNLTYELRNPFYSIGQYKETQLYDYDIENQDLIYKELPEYDANDLQLVLSLYDIYGNGKFIIINENFPLTKKLIIDIFMQDNPKDKINLVSDQLVYTAFGITSIDDSYNLVEEVAHHYNNISSNKITISLSEELVNLLQTAISREPDYDNMYLLKLSDVDAINVNKTLVSFTQEEYETILLNLDDYLTIIDPNGNPKIINYSGLSASNSDTYLEEEITDTPLEEEITDAPLEEVTTNAPLEEVTTNAPLEEVTA